MRLKIPKKNKQKENCAKGFAKIKEDISAEDRKMAMKKFDISYVTVSRYVNGNIANIHLGISLLTFFKERLRILSERIERALAGSAEARKVMTAIVRKSLESDK
jgi:hypothetical protein